MIIWNSTSDDGDMTTLGLTFHFCLADDTRAGSTGVSVLTQIININNYKLINNYFDTWVSIWWFSGWWCFVSGGFFAADWNNNQSETRIYMFQPIRREYLPVEVTLTVNIVAAAFLHPSTPVPNLTRLEDTLNNQSEISIAHINQSEESIYLGSLRMLSNHLMMEVSDENSFFSLLSVRTINQSEISKILCQPIRGKHIPGYRSHQMSMSTSPRLSLTNQMLVLCCVNLSETSLPANEFLILDNILQTVKTVSYIRHYTLISDLAEQC